MHFYFFILVLKMAALKSFIIPSFITTIDDSAFYVCSSLKSITITSSFVYIKIILSNKTVYRSKFQFLLL